MWYNQVMFIKITKSGQHEYVQLVKSYRENGVVKHKVVLNFGRLDQLENNPSIQRLAIRLQELSKVKNRVDLGSFSKSPDCQLGVRGLPKNMEGVWFGPNFNGVKTPENPV